MITRRGDAADFYAAIPMMRQHRLRQQAFDPALYAPHPDAERRLLRWIGMVAQDPRATLVVAEDEARVLAGFLYATIEREMPIYREDTYALVREWWVEPAFRGRGAGRAMIERAATEFARAGVPQLRVRVAAADHEAIELLRCWGFRAGVCELVRELTPSDL